MSESFVPLAELLGEQDELPQATAPGLAEQLSAAKQKLAGVKDRPAKVGFISLGCPKNLVDTESMLGLLKQEGFQITNEQQAADVLVVNTCSFIDSAKEESIEAILEALEEKKKGNAKSVIVTGCLAQRYVADLKEELPEVDAFVGTSDYGRITSIVDATLLGQKVDAVGNPSELRDWNFDRLLATSGTTAYLKIAEGCNCACTFCIIPHLRGAHRSRPLESVVDEARRLVATGTKELVVISQDSTFYGVDLYGKPMLAELLRQLAQLDVEWIRLHYAYPSRLTDEVIDVMASEPKIAKYLDIPLQHGSDKVLKEMNRPLGREKYIRLVKKLKERMPEISLRSGFIAGFPGETEAEFAELLSFLQEIEFDHVGVFAYSTEEGTPAGAREDQIPEEVRAERAARAMEVQRPIAEVRRQRLVGKTLRVLVEGQSEVTAQLFYGRHEGQAPGIDGVVWFTAQPANPPVKGSFVSVEIGEVKGYDLVGVLRA